MSDQTITQLSAISALDDDDVLVVVEDGTTKKVTIAELRVALGAGAWTEDSSWVYVGAHQFRIENVDVTAEFPIGTRIRYKQGGSYEYGVVISAAFSTHTTITLATNTDYALANSTITDGAYSYQSCPPGYPSYFAYTPTWAASGTQPVLNNGSVGAKFKIDGRTCEFHIGYLFGNTTTFGTGTYNWSMPVTAIQIGSSSYQMGVAGAIQPGVDYRTGFIAVNGATFSVFTATGTGTFWGQTNPSSWGDTHQMWFTGVVFF